MLRSAVANQSGPAQTGNREWNKNISDKHSANTAAPLAVRADPIVLAVRHTANGYG